MDNIITIKGKVKYSITLDPGVWIFDDRRIDLNTYFEASGEEVDELEEYKKSISKHWDREIMEGAVYPPTLSTEKKYEKEKVLTGSFGMPLKPFLKNAEILESAEILFLETSEGDVKLPLTEGEKLILGFSKEGKPLSEGGPVHVYYGDGSNEKDPIMGVKAIRIE